MNLEVLSLMSFNRMAIEGSEYVMGIRQRWQILHERLICIAGTTNLHCSNELLEAEKPLSLYIRNRPHLVQNITKISGGFCQLIKLQHNCIEPEMRHSKGSTARS